MAGASEGLYHNFYLRWLVSWSKDTSTTLVANSTPAYITGK